MTNNGQHSGSNPELEREDSLGRLIAWAGRRAEPPELLEAQVRAAVRDEWQRISDRRRRRNYMIVAAAAVVTFAAVGVGVLLQMPQPQSLEPIGQVVRASGDVRFIEPDGTLVRVGAAPFEERVRAGSEVATAADSGVNLLIDGNVSVRVGASTHLKWLDGRRVRLLAGAVYVDSPSDDAASAGRAPRRMTIETDYGRITHVGTQYLVMVAPSGLTVRVREGVVIVDAESARQVARATEEVSIDRKGTVSRSRISPYGDAWGWVEALAGEFDITNRSVLDFLEWVSRETGRPVEFASPTLRREAANAVLQGSTRGMPVDQALDSVMATTNFAAAARDGRLLVTSR